MRLRNRNKRRKGLLSGLRSPGFLSRGRQPRDSVDDLVVSGASSAAAEEAARHAGQRASGAGRAANRKRDNPLWTVLAWLLPMAAAVAAFATPFLGARAYEYLMQSGHFFVREVVVVGADHLSPDEVRDQAGIEPGTHVLATDLDQMRDRLEAHPWVARARVQRELPDRLSLRVDEHRPVAYLSTDEGLVLVDVAGEPFAPTGPGFDGDLPILTGIAPDAFDREATAAVARADVRAAVNLTQLYRVMGLAGRWPISEARVEAGRRLTLVLSDSGTEAVLGSGPYRHKLYRLEWVLEKLHEEGKVADYVLLDTWGPSLRGMDDGRVVVRADLAPSDDEVAEAASARTKEALRGLLPQGMVGPPAPDAGGDEDVEDPVGQPAQVSPGVRPAASPTTPHDEHAGSPGSASHGLHAEP